MNRFVKSAVLTGLVAVFGATSAVAQNTDTDDIDVTAIVETALNVTGGQDLAFGPIFPGFGRTIAASDAASGDFAIAGGVDGGVDITFLLPALLTDPVSLQTMPVSFTAAAGATRASSVAFDPTALHQNTLDATTGTLNVYLGGTVTSAPTQAAGSYSATVSMTASYNGL